MNLVLLVFQCIIEICLIYTIVRLEFEANRLEIVLKKILGYSIVERIGRQFILTIISGIIGIVISIIVCALLKVTYVYCVCVIITCAILIELLIMGVLFIQIERDSIQRTLKGGFF